MGRTMEQMDQLLGRVDGLLLHTRTDEEERLTAAVAASQVARNATANAEVKAAQAMTNAVDKAAANLAQTWYSQAEVEADEAHELEASKSLISDATLRTPEGQLTPKQSELLARLEAIPVVRRSPQQSRQILFLKASPSQLELLLGNELGKAPAPTLVSPAARDDADTETQSTEAIAANDRLSREEQRELIKRKLAEQISATNVGAGGFGMFSGEASGEVFCAEAKVAAVEGLLQRKAESKVTAKLVQGLQTQVMHLTNRVSALEEALRQSEQLLRAQTEASENALFKQFRVFSARVEAQMDASVVRMNEARGQSEQSLRDYAARELRAQADASEGILHLELAHLADLHVSESAKLEEIARQTRLSAASPNLNRFSNRSTTVTEPTLAASPVRLSHASPNVSRSLSRSPKATEPSPATSPNWSSPKVAETSLRVEVHKHLKQSGSVGAIPLSESGHTLVELQHFSRHTSNSRSRLASTGVPHRSAPALPPPGPVLVQPISPLVVTTRYMADDALHQACLSVDLDKISRALEAHSSVASKKEVVHARKVRDRLKLEVERKKEVVGDDFDMPVTESREPI
jgi:hypothetical protein